MKPIIQLIIGGAVILLINNLILIQVMEKRFQKNLTNTVLIGPEGPDTQVAPRQSLTATPHSSFAPGENLKSNVTSLHQPSQIGNQQLNTNLYEELRQLTEQGYLHELFMASHEKQKEMKEKLKNASAEELLAMLDSGNPMEKQIAFSEFVEKHLDSADSETLQKLYQTEGVSIWEKQELVEHLMDVNQEEGLKLAIQHLEKEEEGMGQWSLWRKVVQADPEYVAETLSNTSLDDPKVESILSSLHESSTQQLGVDFFNKHFDSLTDPKGSHSDLLRYMHDRSQLNDQQREKLLGLLDSNNQAARKRALSFVDDFSNIQHLEIARSKLRTQEDKKRFIREVMWSTHNQSSHMELIAPLVQELNNTGLSKQYEKIKKQVESGEKPQRQNRPDFDGFYYHD